MAVSRSSVPSSESSRIERMKERVPCMENAEKMASLLRGRVLTEANLRKTAFVVEKSGSSRTSKKIDEKPETSKALSSHDISRLIKSSQIGDISVGIAHDNNNIMMALFHYLTLLKLEVNKADGKMDPESLLNINSIITLLEEALERIKTTNKKMLELGRKGKDTSVENLSLMIESLLGLTRSTIADIERNEKKTAVILNNIDKQHYAKIVKSDTEMCVFNMVLNAIKHGISAGEMITISFNSYIKDDFVYLEIANDGKPIPPEIRDTLLNEPLSSNCINGYGLYISSENIRDFGGELSFTSDADKTVFTIKLPCVS